jgi:(R,R)-butanediol dehydrogenase/meso-butanediol dehydrogenase/diacetyl reductase
VRAVAMTGVRRLELIDAPQPEPLPGDLKLRVRYCGICGSDLHEYEHGASGRLGGDLSPIMGHECTGEVAALGRGVSGFELGDLVVVIPGREPCGRCEFCRAGEEERCALTMGVGYHRPGAYAEYVCTRADRAVKVGVDAPADQTAMSEPFAVARHGISQSGLQPGESVLITGAGPIGALSVIAARQAQAGIIIVSEPARRRRELARVLGATVLDPAEGPVPDRVRELAGAEGVDVALECAGVGPAMDDCLTSLRYGGRVAVLSLFGEAYPINLLALMVTEKRVIGSYGSGAGGIAEAAALIASGKVDVGPLISARISLDEVPATFAAIAADRSLHNKVLIRPDL